MYISQAMIQTYKDQRLKHPFPYREDWLERMDEGNWLQEATCAAYVRQVGTWGLLYCGGGWLVVWLAK